MTLTEFLLARLAEDAAASVEARRWSDRDWNDFNQPGKPACLFADHSQSLLTAFDVGPVGDAVTIHAARWDPARVLAECEAKRRIVEEYLDTENTLARSEQDDQWEAAAAWSERRSALEPVLQALAAVYADHPDYLTEWAPHE